MLRFEQDFAKEVGARYALAVTSGTAALKVALVAAGVGPGHEVIVPCCTFIASPSSVVTAGAVPIFAGTLLITGIVVTLVPLTLAYFVGRKMLHMNPLMLLGAILSLRGIRNALPFLFLVFAYGVGLTIFYPLAHYRAPVLPAAIRSIPIASRKGTVISHARARPKAAKPSPMRPR